MTCFKWVSAEFVGNNLILTDISGNTRDINLVLAECRIIGDSFSVSSLLTKSGPIADDNELLGPGTPLTYQDVRDAITAATA